MELHEKLQFCLLYSAVFRTCQNYCIGLDQPLVAQERLDTVSMFLIQQIQH